MAISRKSFISRLISNRNSITPGSPDERSDVPSYPSERRTMGRNCITHASLDERNDVHLGIADTPPPSRGRTMPMHFISQASSDERLDVLLGDRVNAPVPLRRSIQEQSQPEDVNLANDGGHRFRLEDPVLSNDEQDFNPQVEGYVYTCILSADSGYPTSLSCRLGLDSNCEQWNDSMNDSLTYKKPVYTRPNFDYFTHDDLDSSNSDDEY